MGAVAGLKAKESEHGAAGGTDGEEAGQTRTRTGAARWRGCGPVYLAARPGPQLRQRADTSTERLEPPKTRQGHQTRTRTANGSR